MSTRISLARILAQNLRKRRKDLSQKEFSKKLGISRATLTRLENAGQNTTIQTLETIIHSQRCSIGELFDPNY